MMTCMPMRMCVVTESRARRITTATRGLERVARAASKLGAGDGDDDADEQHRQHEIRRAGYALEEEVVGAGAGRTEPPHAAERRAHGSVVGVMSLRIAHETSPQPFSARAMTHTITVSATEPASVALASSTRSLAPKPWMKSQMKWRTPPRAWWISAQV